LKKGTERSRFLKGFQWALIVIVILVALVCLFVSLWLPREFERRLVEVGAFEPDGLSLDSIEFRSHCIEFFVTLNNGFEAVSADGFKIEVPYGTLFFSDNFSGSLFTVYGLSIAFAEGGQGVVEDSFQTMLSQYAEWLNGVDLNGISICADDLSLRFCGLDLFLSLRGEWFIGEDFEKQVILDFERPSVEVGIHVRLDSKGESMDVDFWGEAGRQFIRDHCIALNYTIKGWSVRSPLYPNLSTNKEPLVFFDISGFLRWEASRGGLYSAAILGNVEAFEARSKISRLNVENSVFAFTKRTDVGLKGYWKAPVRSFDIGGFRRHQGEMSVRWDQHEMLYELTAGEDQLTTKLDLREIVSSFQQELNFLDFYLNGEPFSIEGDEG